MSRPKFQSIPLELRQVKAYELYRKRIIANQEGSSEDDWYEAGEYLAKHPRVVLAWQLKQIIDNLLRWGQVQIRRLWQFFKSLLDTVWKILTFPFWLFWNLTTLFANTDSRPFALDVVKTVISAIGLIATVMAGLGLFFNYQNAQERLITERFSKAVEQIGNNKEEVIIGGIYSLERIAKDSPKDQWTIMEVLTSFVRKNSRIPPEIQKLPDGDEKQKALEKLQPVNIQVQTALTVIGRRDLKHDSTQKDLLKTLDLSASNLKGANFYKANLSEADFSGAVLSVANFSEADFSGAVLSVANLSGARFFGANFSVANLIGANLSGIILIDANFSRANLNGANLSEADFSRANFSEAILVMANLSRANLSEADFSRANFSEAILVMANLSRANLIGADLFIANLSGANLDGANLNGTRNLNPHQIKSACHWEEAVYSDAQWNENLSQWVAKDEKANQQKISALKQDKASDPKEPVDCSM